MSKSQKIKKIKFKITQKDIANGTINCPSKCPIALAISKKIKNGWKVGVYDEEAYFYKRVNQYKTNSYSSILPKLLVDFVEMYDDECVSKSLLRKILKTNFELEFRLMG